ncbi:unnamed protein product [Rangifer tarandus platyrhynchus]|uniref:Uncharacterized protein n=1 Tax=Rangifer tarandus platyrhynchus TaxID=3082113 RepID=A0ABN8YQP1_RANTA|nr:unnamed protein product [Rangifer tarandus platyrhynchus]
MHCLEVCDLTPEVYQVLKQRSLRTLELLISSGFGRTTPMGPTPMGPRNHPVRCLPTLGRLAIAIHASPGYAASGRCVGMGGEVFIPRPSLPRDWGCKWIIQSPWDSARWIGCLSSLPPSAPPAPQVAQAPCGALCLP